MISVLKTGSKSRVLLSLSEHDEYKKVIEIVINIIHMILSNILNCIFAFM